MSSTTQLHKFTNRYPQVNSQADKISTSAPTLNKQELWLAFHFTQLSLEAAFPKSILQSQPCGIWESSGQRQILTAINHLSKNSGLHTGTKVSEAWVQIPNLNISPREHQTEQTYLDKLEAIALNFSSKVSLHRRHTLLLEIAGSLRLFNGLEKLLLSICNELSVLSKNYSYSVMPTPAASLLCASSNTQSIVFEKHLIYSSISKIPIYYFEYDHKTLQTFERMGISNMRDLLRLPRQGLSKRFGKSLINRIDSLTGESPDPQLFVKPRLYFNSRQDMDDATTNTEQIIQANEVLLKQLESFLTINDCIARLFLWTLHCRTHAQEIIIRPGVICRCASDLSALFDLQLESISLSSSVNSVTLEAREFEDYRPEHYSLFLNNAPKPQNDPQVLIDRLRVRLGHQSVYGLRTVEDYRPEQAWETCEPGDSISGYLPQRKGYPLWILKKAVPLKYNSPNLYFNGLLQLVGQAEHIKFGWWDKYPMNRDYQKATTKDGQLLWVYRDKNKDSWFLHGFFN